MRELAFGLIGIGVILSWLSMLLTLFMISKINDKLPPNERLTIPFVRVSGSQLRRMYAQFYPDGRIHIKVRLLSATALLTGIAGTLLLVNSLRS
jgi:hypothetical protein